MLPAGTVKAGRGRGRRRSYSALNREGRLVSTLLAEARNSSNLLPVIYWGEEFLINAPSPALQGAADDRPTVLQAKPRWSALDQFGDIGVSEER